MNIDDVYVNFWGKPKVKFSELEIAIMEGGHSLEKEKKFSFLAELKIPNKQFLDNLDHNND